MYLSIKWLQNYVDLRNITPVELAEKLTHAGIEVESMHKLSLATNCVVGHVVEKMKHPEADKLSVCKVNIGEEVSQIVCGAPNVASGQKVIVSKVGATLPGGIKIKAAKLRGVESNGMICSLKELGIENKYIPQEFQNGIYILDNDAPVGKDALEYLGFDDTVLELKTLNRSDCLSMIGLAYEVATILDREVKKPAGEVVPFTNNKGFTVKIESDDCSLYHAKIVKNIKIKPSPLYIQSALIACGIRPINNVVDVTNYVMMELGQPLHAFDYKKLNSKQILVRNAFNKETIVTLDNVKRELVSSDLLITDGVNPIALAGVMGGQSTEIDDTTTEVLLESAVFKPITVRRTSTRLGLRSESSLRFEKKVDPKRALYALNRAALLLEDIANAENNNLLSSAIKEEEKEVLINITLDKINRVLGTRLTEHEVAETFRRLKFSFVVLQGSFVVTVPTRRPDITIEEDLIEEIIRIHGYRNLEKTLPLTDTVGELTPTQKKIRSVRKTLQACALNEVVTYSLISEKSSKRFLHHKDSSFNPVKLLMPMSEERSVMRYSLVHSLLEVIRYNNARNMSDISIFEVGKRSFFLNETPQEELLLSGAITGTVNETKWQKKLEQVDFYYLKGVLEAVFDNLRVNQDIKFVQADHLLGEDYHPMRTAYIYLNEEYIGLIGQIHPNTQKEYDLLDTYVFEVNLGRVLAYEGKPIRFESISKYPTVSRDIAIVADETISAQELLEAIYSKGKNILKAVDVFDVYQGEHVEKNKKSIAFSLTFESANRTLTDDEVNVAYEGIIKHLESKFNAILRK